MDGARLAHSVRLLLIADHTVVGAGLQRMLVAESDIDVVGVARTVPTGAQLAATTQPTVVLVDLHSPTLEDVRRVAEVLRVVPTCKLLLLADTPDEHRICAGIQAGAIGCVLKSDPPTTLIAAIHLAARDESVLPTAVVTALVRQSVAQVGPAIHRPAVVDTERLSDRERVVLALVAQGHSNRVIADTLVISTDTVKNHITHILGKLAVADRKQAVARARELGLL